ncbi:hypothetical protein KIPB_009454 [Kipferlia bialata]|uniref:Uncharacterized protein n=1 Tax=Kipferlia bialata TaxID=797122 RepID=A0A9K3GKS1_9EUKA|nr:hypothetical protein KIPB_009454 [Kipferlia bialata]|eukprot:g9454.t1
MTKFRLPRPFDLDDCKAAAWIINNQTPDNRIPPTRLNERNQRQFLYALSYAMAHAEDMEDQSCHPEERDDDIVIPAGTVIPFPLLQLLPRTCSILDAPVPFRRSDLEMLFEVANREADLFEQAHHDGVVLVRSPPLEVENEAEPWNSPKFECYATPHHVEVTALTMAKMRIGYALIGDDLRNIGEGPDQRKRKNISSSDHTCWEAATLEPLAEIVDTPNPTLAPAERLRRTERDAAEVRLAAAIAERDTALEKVTDVTRQRDEARSQRDAVETRATDLAIQLSMTEDLLVQLEEREQGWVSDAAERERLQTSVTQLQDDLSVEREVSTGLRHTVASVTEQRDTLADEMQGLRLQALEFERAHLERERERHRSEVAALHEAHALEMGEFEETETRRREFLSRRLRTTIRQRDQERTTVQECERVIESLRGEIGRNMLEPLSEADEEAVIGEVVEVE